MTEQSNAANDSVTHTTAGAESTITGSVDPWAAISVLPTPASRYRSPRALPELRVWAPYASSVEIEVGRREDFDGSVSRYPMNSVTGGWWEVADDGDAVPSASSARYAFVIDGDQPRPDPRSARQPDGVHAASALFTVDHDAWTDGAWTGRTIAGAVIYELHIGTFTPEGTLDSASGRIDHLVDLGVDFVELMPVNAFNGSHNWGYDGVDWYAVQETYGGPAALARFVDACHTRGIGVVLDVVYNHLGPSGNYLPEFGPYLTAGANNWGSSLNLCEPDSDTVRTFILDTALRWFSEFHVDALRLDAVHALVDHRAVHILEELAMATDALAVQLGRPLSLIAESDLNDPRLILSRSHGGYGLTAQWSDDIHHAIHAAVSGERQGYYADFGSYPCLAKVLRGGFFHDGTYSSFRRRSHGRPIPTSLIDASALLAYTCNHDQIGNRAVGDRPTAYLDGGQLAIKAALVVLSPFTPMLFMGEEWAASTPFAFFTAHPEPELAEAVRTGRRAEFAEHGWHTEDVPDPQDPATFIASKLDWTERQRPANSRMLDFYRALIALRKSEPALHAPTFDSVDIDFDENAGWFTMHRDTWTVVCNPSGHHTSVPIQLDVTLSWGEVSSNDDSLHLGAHSVAVGRRH